MFGVKLVSEILFVHFRACSIFSMFCDNSKISGGKAPVLQRERMFHLHLPNKRIEAKCSTSQAKSLLELGRLLFYY